MTWNRSTKKPKIWLAWVASLSLAHNKWRASMKKRLTRKKTLREHNRTQVSRCLLVRVRLLNEQNNLVPVS